MITTRRLLTTLLFSLFLCATVLAQTPTPTPRDTALPIDGQPPPKPPATQSSTPLVTATTSSQRVRYISVGEVNQTRLQVFSADGTQVFDSDYRLGNLIDWQLTDQQGSRLSDGSYLFLVTVKDFSGTLTQKYGTATLEPAQVYLQQVSRDELSAAQATTLAANQLSATLASVDRIGAAGLTQSTTAATDGTTTIDTVTTTGKKTTKKATTGGNNLTGTGTQNQVAKWTDNAGTLGDSAVAEVNGNVGIGTSNPLGKLHLVDAVGSATTGDNTFRIESTGGNVGPSFRFKSAEGADFLMTATGSGNTGGAGAFRIFDYTHIITRFFIAPTGNIGIGTITPAAKLDVVGAINTSTQYNLGGSRVLGVSAAAENTFTGILAGNANTGSNNSFFGSQAGVSNTGGGFNSFIGTRAGFLNTIGNDDSFVGTFAGYHNLSGSRNAFVGRSAGESNTTGSDNSFIGYNAGLGNTTGFSNTLIGESANVGANNLSNATAIGASAIVSQSNSLILGNGANVGIGTSTPNTRLTLSGGTPWTSNSWSASMNMQNGSAFGWEANASGQRFGIGHTDGGLYFFRTNSAFGATGSPANYDLAIQDDGNITQARNESGLVKAMIYVNGDGTIKRCYNGITNSSTGNCGVVISADPTNGYYTIGFNFQIDDRFVSVTPEMATSSEITGTGFSILSSNGILVRTTVNDVFVSRPFMLIVY
jgi:hypothetical protein